MRRPPAVPTDALVDAEACARAGSVIERRFTTADLPRAREAGALAGTAIEVRFQFSRFGGEPAVEGRLRGTLVLTCQRCMQAIARPVDEPFQLLIVSADRDGEPGGYEPLAVADPARLDLCWLAEDQVLLALPLAPLHEPDECPVERDERDGERVQSEAPPRGGDEAARQKPFDTLRELLRPR